MLETPQNEMTEEIGKQIVNLTILADRRCRGLYDVVLSEILVNDNYSMSVSNYHSRVESPSSIEVKHGMASVVVEETPGSYIF